MSVSLAHHDYVLPGEKLRSWRSPKVAITTGALLGSGLFAVSHLDADELIAIKAGHILDESYIRDHAEMINGTHLQIAEDFFLAPVMEEERSDIGIGFNHSCAPNAYIDGQIVLRTMHAIDEGDEITVDYATFTTSDTLEFDCACDTATCRRHVKPSVDWQDPQLQVRYRGFFSTMVAAKIKSAET
jgi:hypothetical protein